MSDDNKILAQNHSIAESIRPDIFEIERLMSLRKSQRDDVIDELLQEKIQEYLEHLGYALKAARSIIEYVNSND